MPLFLMLLPWIELFTLIQLGVQTSALTALFYVFATFALGLWLLRRQGEGVMQRMREQQMGRVIGPELLMDNMVVGLAGILLLIPGMVTDFAAAVVLIGPLRRRLVAWMRSDQPDVESYRHNTQQPHEKVTLEGDYHRVDE